MSATTVPALDEADTVFDETANNIRECLEEILTLDGAVGAALVEWTTSTLLDAVSKPGVEHTAEAAVGCAGVVLSKVAVMGTVEQIEPIEDIIISLGQQYHVMRLLKGCPTTCLYARFDRATANLARLRLKLEEIEDLLVFDDMNATLF